MKFQCPKCHTAYQMEFSNLGEAGVAVECAKCHKKFRVKKKASPQKVAAHSHAKEDLSPPGEMESHADLPMEEKHESDFVEEPTSVTEDSFSSPETDSEIDDLIAKFVKKEHLEDEAPDEPSTSEKTPSHTFQEEELDDLLNDLIGGETSSSIDEATANELQNIVDELTAVSPPQEDPSDNPDITDVAQPSPEESTTAEAVPAVEDHLEKAEENFVPTPGEDIQEEIIDELSEQESTENAQETEIEKDPEIETPEEPALEQAIDEPEQEPETVEEKQETPEETKSEAPPAPEAKAEPEEEKEKSDSEEMSDEDLWAQAFADQEKAEQEQKTEEKQETPEEAESETPPSPEAKAEPEEEKEKSDSEEMSDEDLWAQAFADQDKTEQEQKGDAKEESEESSVQEETTAPEGKEEVKEEVAAEPAAEETTESAKSEETAEETAAEPEEEKEEPEESSAPEETTASEGEEEVKEEVDAEPAAEETTESAESEATPEESSEEAGDVDEEVPEEEEGEPEEEEEEVLPGFPDPADYDDDEEYEEPVQKKKFGFISLPKSKTGKVILTSGVAALALIAGGIYFGMQTFLPPELAQLINEKMNIEDASAPTENQAIEQEVVPAPEAGDVGDITKQDETPITGEPSQTGEPATTGEAAKAEDSPTPDAPKLTDNLKTEETEITEKVSEAIAPLESHGIEIVTNETDKDKKPSNEELLATVFSPVKTIHLSTILPVAYSSNDIRVLSFDLELELSNPETAQFIQDALPVYEKIMIATVEKFLDKKFYNDILYVKEKLRKQIQNDINKSLRKGRVKRTKFNDFLVQ